jgi:lipopolysaccharide heptosyltransferase II
LPSAAVSVQLEPGKILIVRLSSLGDVIQTTPLLGALRRSFPRAVIGWAIDEELAPAIAGHCDLDTVHACPRHRWRGGHPLAWPRAARELSGFAAEIRRAGYDLAIDAQGLLISALIPFMAGIGRRVGFAHRRELSHFFYTEMHVSKEDYFASGRHHSEHMLALARAIGCAIDGCRPSLPEVAPQVRRAVDAMLERAFGTAAFVIAIAPGTRWSSKHWPFEYWVELLRMVLARTPSNVVLAGSRGEAPLCERLLAAQPEAARTRILNLAGKTSLLELFALLGRVPVTIAPDSAPLHAAGAMRCPHLIGIYGPTPGTRTGPLGDTDINLLSSQPSLACQPCRSPRCRYGTNQCMRNVAPSAVFAALERALSMELSNR